MSMKINIPWQIRLPAMKTRSPRSGSWWNRSRFKKPASAPSRSVLMKEDDLDHLGALHHAAEQSSKK